MTARSGGGVKIRRFTAKRLRTLLPSIGTVYMLEGLYDIQWVALPAA
jgi:hypothetical protein